MKLHNLNPDIQWIKLMSHLSIFKAIKLTTIHQPADTKCSFLDFCFFMMRNRLILPISTLDNLVKILEPNVICIEANKLSKLIKVQLLPQNLRIYQIDFSPAVFGTIRF